MSGLPSIRVGIRRIIQTQWDTGMAHGNVAMLIPFSPARTSTTDPTSFAIIRSRESKNGRRNGRFSPSTLGYNRLELVHLSIAVEIRIEQTWCGFVEKAVTVQAYKVIQAAENPLCSCQHVGSGAVDAGRGTAESSTACVIPFGGCHLLYEARGPERRGVRVCIGRRGATREKRPSHRHGI
jgi:hypothetical protein